MRYWLFLSLSLFLSVAAIAHAQTDPIAVDDVNVYVASAGRHGIEIYQGQQGGGGMRIRLTAISGKVREVPFPTAAVRALAVGPDHTIYLAGGDGEGVWAIDPAGTPRRIVDRSFDSLAWGAGVLYLFELSSGSVMRWSADEGLKDEFRFLENVPDKLAWNGKELLAFRMDSGDLYRCPVAPSALAPTEQRFTLRQPQRIHLPAQNAPYRDFSAHGDLVGALGTNGLIVYALTTANWAILPYNLLWKTTPARFAAGRRALYFGTPGATMQWLPALSPVTLLLERGLPSESTTELYDYLDQRGLLPLRPYTIVKGDNLQSVVKRLGVLPAGYTRTLPDHPEKKGFQALFCEWNLKRCVPNTNDIITFQIGQTIRLPDIRLEPYVARREFNLPLSDDYVGDVYRKLKNQPLARFAEVFLPSMTSAEDRVERVQQLNYDYTGPNLLSETKGAYIIPIESFRTTVLIPQSEAMSSDSEFARLLSRNVKRLPPPLWIGATSPSPKAILPPDTCPGPPIVPVVAFENCQPLDPGVYTKFHMQIRFCVPTGVSVVQIAILDSIFDPNHPEFLDKDGKTIVTFYGEKPENVQTDRIDNEYVAKFSVEADHGTYTMGLAAARNSKNEMIGINPQALIAAARPEKLKDLLDRIPTLRIVNISLGETSLAPLLPGLTSVVGDPSYQKVLFVISSGNDGQEIVGGSLASLESQNNVIGVGASAWSTNHPQLLDLTNFPVDVAAPGQCIKSALYQGGYGRASGTSVAAPLVSATASLIQGSGGEKWSPWQIKQRILSTADLWIKRNGATSVRSGLLNVERAVRFLNESRVEWALGDAKVTCHGRIAKQDLDRKIDVRAYDSASFVLRDVRRLVANPDGTYTVLFEATDSETHQQRLRALLNVPSKNIYTGDQSAALDFSVTDSGGTCTSDLQFHLSQIKDLVNGVY
jgi:hypothetical protein